MSWRGQQRPGEDPLVTITRLIVEDTKKFRADCQKMAEKLHPPIKKPADVPYAPPPGGTFNVWARKEAQRSPHFAPWMIGLGRLIGRGARAAWRVIAGIGRLLSGPWARFRQVPWWAAVAWFAGGMVSVEAVRWWSGGG